jgi:hypothetical protein
MARNYRWVDGCRLKGDAQTVGEFLDALRKKHDGVLTTGIVVAAAKNPRSPIHDFFTWDDKDAATRWREVQAGHLIRSVTIFVEEREDVAVRAFVNIEGPGHVCVVEAMNDEAMKATLFKRAKDEIIGWRRRYADLQAFASVFKSVDAIAAS